MDNYTSNNINSIRYQIGLKLNYNVPYYATQESAQSILTDMDHFPYKRYFRGKYNEDNPILFEREAGFRPRRDKCYMHLSIPQPFKPNYCWEYPCSTVLPCKDDKKVVPEKNCKRQNFVISP